MFLGFLQYNFSEPLSVFFNKNFRFSLFQIGTIDARGSRQLLVQSEKCIFSTRKFYKVPSYNFEESKKINWTIKLAENFTVSRERLLVPFIQFKELTQMVVTG